ncbi:hypothetical protein BDQ17DRAFT_1386733 [Cyathus striatus]|nr:hypothetical protein BDQ17DRAFT_1386733 [Cyathus striatus]
MQKGLNRAQHMSYATRLLLAQCRTLRTPAGPPPSFSPASRARTGSERYVPGTPSFLIQNARIWTGANDGKEIFYGNLLLDKGVPGGDLKIIDAGGKWVTPGIVDLHSHLGVSSAPHLRGAADGNSHAAPILPWLRSIDGLNTHDESYPLVVAGGVTTAQVLPGSANNIGGQAYLIKLRHTEERSTTSMILEPPIQLHAENITGHTYDYVPWRHMKHACGENPSRVYSQTRMDSSWNFRSAYEEARKIKDSQDAYCVKVEKGLWGELSEEELSGGVPQELKWESLVDVLRGKVKAVDLDMIVRLTNEFKFPVASFHHAGETYLVPDLLKKAWGGAPSIALFANNFKKKREAYRGSEFAPRVLAEHGIPVVMKSDHPVLNSRYLLYEAQQAFFYGLDPGLALASVTSTPARAAGVGHRVGTIAKGYDADIVIWDSHPLTLGATPVQVFIDGIPQLANPKPLSKPKNFQQLPKVPNFDKEAREAVEWEGVPPLQGRKAKSFVRFVNVSSVWGRDERGEVEALLGGDGDNNLSKTGGVVLVRNGKIECISSPLSSCAPNVDAGDIEEVDLEGGSISPGLTTYGSPIGLVEIRLEPSTNDGNVLDPLTGGNLPKIMGEDMVVRAVDGLQFGGRNTLLAYHDGVTTAITAPSGSGFVRGISTTFLTGAWSASEKGAVLMEETALHITVSPSLSVSVSTQIAALRRLLYGSAGSRVWEKGSIPLVIDVDGADVMATLLTLKSDYDLDTGHSLRMTFVGATEAHLLAKHIKEAGVSVILTSPRPYPGGWDQRRLLPGPPLTRLTSITALFDEGINVAIGVVDEATARNTRFDIAWAALEANGQLSKRDAFALVTTNLEKALGVPPGAPQDLVAYKGGDALGFESKPTAILSAMAGNVNML